MQTTAVSLAALGALGSTDAPRRPNVLLIILDDLGSVDLNCYGSTDLATPHLDALAGGGVRFTQFYSASPVCSPSRGATLTGCYPQRNGLVDNASSRPGGEGALPPDQPTLATLLKDAGYATGHVGKWHLGYTPETVPMARGFDVSFGHMGGCIDNYSHFFYWNGPNRHDLWENGEEIHREGDYFGDLVVDAARRFITRNKDRSFFLYLPINQPHYPLQGKAHWREHYSKHPSPRNMYAASVSTADEMIGAVLDHLDSLGLRQDTIVVFQSDHGHSTEDRTFGGGGSAGPYRGAKFSCFEGGIRVPAIISYPRALPGGAVRGQLVMGQDWLPTILELTRIDPGGRAIDGRSMLPVIQSAAAATAHSTCHWQLGNQWAVRDGDWKLIGNPIDTSHKAKLSADDALFLSNLANDVSEMNNLASTHPEQVQRLKALHEAWRQSMPHA